MLDGTKAKLLDFLRQRYKRYKARDGKTDEIERPFIEIVLPKQ